MVSEKKIKQAGTMYILANMYVTGHLVATTSFGAPVHKQHFLPHALVGTLTSAHNATKRTGYFQKNCNAVHTQKGPYMDLVGGIGMT